jgi:hypothetical protein
LDRVRSKLSQLTISFINPSYKERITMEDIGLIQQMENVST